MYFVGYPCMEIIKIKNKTNFIIDEIRITYDKNKYKGVFIKKINPESSKQTGISTINIPKNTTLKMYTKQGQSYVIKEGLCSNHVGTTIININSVNFDGSLEFEIDEE